MEETIEIKSLMRVSKLAKILNKSAAWIYKLGHDKLIDLVIIDGVHFVRINDKFHNYVK